MPARSIMSAGRSILALGGGVVAVVAVAVVVAAAGGCANDDGAAAGSERAACRPDGSCDVGLVCWSDACVRPPGADCRAVAHRLAAVRLGNYADDDARRPLASELVATCQRERLTAREGRCLLAAPDDDALAACPRALLPELDPVRRRCTPLGDRMRTVLQPELLLDGIHPDAADQIAKLVGDRCLADRWPAAVVTCIHAAPTLTEVRACTAQLPRAAHRRVDDALDRATARRGRRRLPPPDPWAPQPTLTNVSGPCQRYLALLETYATCDRIPASARDSVRSAIDALKQAWTQMDPSVRPTMDEMCTKGVEGMAPGMRALGCPDPP